MGMSENWREKSGENVRRREKTKSREWGDIDEKVILWLFLTCVMTRWVTRPCSQGSLSCFEKESWLRFVTWFPKSRSQK